jgi:hypothetical protein
VRIFLSLATLTVAASLSGWHVGSVADQPQSGLAANPIDVQRLGPQVAERVPDFSLPDQTGAVRTLRSVMGPKGMMLVLFRSADW